MGRWGRKEEEGARGGQFFYHTGRRGNGIPSRLLTASITNKYKKQKKLREEPHLAFILDNVAPHNEALDVAHPLLASAVYILW